MPTSAVERQVVIPRLVWMRLVRDLRRRGQGRREAGAFLLARSGDQTLRIQRHVCYDDLDPDALKHGVVTLHAAGMAALWDLCRREKMTALADAHTHPTADVRQSLVDAQYPMVPVSGHLAMILPHFGRTSMWSLAGVGMHVFEGAGRWTSYRSGGADSPATLTW